jgi:hypothetical protein
MRLCALVLALSLTGCITINQAPPEEDAPAPAASVTPPPKEEPPPKKEPFEKWKISQVLDAFRAAGLEVGEVAPMQKPKDYGAGPTVALEGQRFLLPSVCPDCGGRIFTYANAEDLELHKKYFDDLGKGSAWLWSWTYARDNILVQLNGKLSEAQAKKYEAALAGMR